METNIHTFSEEDVKKVILKIIHLSSKYETDVLNEKYTDDMITIRILPDGTTNVFGKKEAIAFFNSMKLSKREHLNTETQFNFIEVMDNRALVIITREINLFGIPEKFVITWHLILQDSKWKVTKEIVVSAV